MKTLQKHFGLMVFSAGLMVSAHLSAGGVCRAFTDTQGRTVQGQLMGFDHYKQLVTIQRADNSKPCQAPLAVFSDTDQQYIQTWNFKHEFNHSLRISVARKTFSNPGTVHGKRYPAECIKSIGYEVELENQSATLFDDVEIEYCLFYRQGEHMQRDILFDEGVLYGRCIIESVQSDSSQCLNTEPVLILNETGAITSFGRTEEARGEVLGLWLRVHAMSPSGAVITREYCSPSTLRNFKDWKSNTIAAGLNHTESKAAVHDIQLGTLTLPSMGRFTVE